MASVTCPETERRGDSGRRTCGADASRPDVGHRAHRELRERSPASAGALLLLQGDVDGGRASQWGSGCRGPEVVACPVGCY